MACEMARILGRRVKYCFKLRIFMRCLVVGRTKDRSSANYSVLDLHVLGNPKRESVSEGSVLELRVNVL